MNRKKNTAVIREIECLLTHPLKPSDRAQVQSEEFRLPDSGPIPLDDQDVQIRDDTINGKTPCHEDDQRMHLCF
ncbi:hypothetical protein Tco_1365973 [Tanacetum coccineum]